MKIKSEWLIIVLLVAISGLLRYWRLPERAIFLGDQGRDLILIQNSLKAGRWPLTGQPSSQGINTGPAYYYLTMLALAISKNNPLGTIYFFTSLGILTVILIYYFLEPLTGKLPAFIAALAYALSPQIISQTIGYWNPISIPFLIIIVFYLLYHIKQGKLGLTSILGFVLGVLVQLHTSNYFIILPIAIWWIKILIKKDLKWTFLGLIGTIISLLPFLIFQINNNFIDVKKIMAIIFTINPGPKTGLLTQFYSQFSGVVKLLTNFNSPKINLFLGLILIFIPWLFLSGKNRFWFMFILVWFLSGLLTLTLYPGTVFVHYAAFNWIMPFLILGFFLKSLDRIPKIISLVVGLSLLFWLSINLDQAFNYPNDLARTQNQAKLIAGQAGDHKVALSLMSVRTPSDAHLRYFLANINLVSIDDPEAEMLFLVCEDKCPSEQDLLSTSINDSECLPDCPPYYETKALDFNHWQYNRTIESTTQKIFILKPRPNKN